jgi:F0F1-type ATP synthase beta subunit
VGIVGCILFLPLGILKLLMTNTLAKTKITITQKKLIATYGQYFSHNITLPTDSISGVICRDISRGFTIKTPSKNITIVGVNNYKEILNVINELISNRGNTTESTTIFTQASNAEELKKYKDLLDQGIITQEEFDAKKKQLLGL